MLLLKIMVLLLGLGFSGFGYFICFRKKYNFINGYEADYQAGRKDERYAQRVGLIEFILGIVLLIAGAALLIFA